MDRRTFIKLTAVTGTSATLASCGNPEHQLIRFVPDEDLTPGIAEWKPSRCPVCSAGCGVIVRVMDGDAEVIRDRQLGVMRMGLAKKLEGNPAHPISQGALCARGQAAIQLTYHPDRIANPLKRSGARGSGQFTAISWDDALAELLSHLDAVAANPRSLAFVTRGRNTARQDLIAQFLDRFGAPAPVVHDIFTDDVVRRANQLSFGHAQTPTFDLAHSRYVIGFGADFLGTWNSPVAQMASFGEMRQGRSGLRAKFVHCESRMTPTGACADEWVPVRPGTEGVLALGLAHVMLAAKLRPVDAAGRAGALIEGWSAGLPAYAPADVEKLTGVDARRIERLAREFADGRPAVAIIGGAPLAHTNGLFQALAINALNALAGSVGETGGLSFMPQIDRGKAPDSRSLSALASDVLAGSQSPVQALLIDDADPVFLAPAAWRMREALGKVPFIASFSGFLNDTSAMADLILPDHSFLESWVEGRPESGAAVAVATVAPPAMRPLHDTRATADVLLEVSRRLMRPLNFPWSSFEDMLKASFAPLAAKPDDADDLWSTARKQGGWWGMPPKPAAAATNAKDTSNPTALSRAEAQFDGDAAQFPFHFLPFASPALLDGSIAHLPWLQELPDPTTSAMWSTWVEINPRTAERLGVHEGDVIEVASRVGTLRAPAVVSPGIAPDVVAMPVGQGHETFTRYASKRGANPIGILAPATEQTTGSLAWAATRVKITRVSGPDGSLILFAGGLREEPDLRRG
jgi:anaerobic selenocysteine-containing dehydrogenase